MQSSRAQVPVPSGVAQAAGSGTGHVTGYDEEYVALLQQLLEVEGGRAALNYVVSPYDSKQHYGAGCSGF